MIYTKLRICFQGRTRYSWYIDKSCLTFSLYNTADYRTDVFTVSQWITGQMYSRYASGLQEICIHGMPVDYRTDVFTVSHWITGQMYSRYASGLQDRCIHGIPELELNIHAV